MIGPEETRTAAIRFLEKSFCLVLYVSRGTGKEECVCRLVRKRKNGKMHVRFSKEQLLASLSPLSFLSRRKPTGPGVRAQRLHVPLSWK